MTKKKPNYKMDEEEDQTLQDVLDMLKIGKWDYILIGDGAGSGWNGPIGWACVSIERRTQERLVWNGCANRGTVNFAEIMAYVTPLTWFQAREEENRKALGTRAHRVHIITDSDYCRMMGSANARSMVKNAILWAALDNVKRQGFVLHWHWLRRDTADLNRFCDRVSVLSRLMIKKFNLQEKVEEEMGGTVNAINPSEENE